LTAAQALDVEQQTNLLVMTGVSGSLDDSEAEAVARFGSVILMEQDGKSAKQVTKLVKQIKALNPDIVVSTDQEGGLVQRLDGSGFPAMPSAVKQAKMSDAELQEQAREWGKVLADVGVTLNLAPVADTVGNAATNAPIGELKRGYGTDPDVVTQKVRSFAAGMRQEGVAATLKHFPGLGYVSGNTDYTARVVDSKTTEDSASLEPFKNALEFADVVMVSSAVYTKIDPDSIAVYSPTVVGILRDWGYDGVISSDDLGAAKAAQSVSAAKRAVAVVKAGGDLAMSVDPAAATKMGDGLLKAAKKDSSLAALVEKSAARMLKLQGKC
jgi:beta-N-acetylhexosaminidase